MECPSDEDFKCFLSDPSNSSEIVGHLAHCLECQHRLNSFDSAPNLDAIRLSLSNHIHGTIPNHIHGTIPQPKSTLTRRSPSLFDAETRVYDQQVIRRIGQYDLYRKIGRGGGGEVFEAIHIRLRCRRAVKLLASKDSGDELIRRRFFREMESIGQLNHPHIVQAHDAGEVDGTLYLAMELIDGDNIESLARGIGPLPVPEACEIIRQAAVGLQHIFESGLVHRDIKPSNLLMSGTQLKIADLGLALLQRQAPEDDRLTGEHMVIGTADYMAPEQCSGAQDIDIRADLYSLGCTLFRLLSGHPPFQSVDNPTPLRKMWAHQNLSIPEFPQSRSDIPEGLRAIVRKLTAKDRDQRYSEPKELVEALSPYCQPLDVLSRSQSTPALFQTVDRGSTAGGRTTFRVSPSVLPNVTVILSRLVSRLPNSTHLNALMICGILIFGWLGIKSFGFLGHANRLGNPNESSSGDGDENGHRNAPITPLGLHDEQPLEPIARKWRDVFGVSPTEINWPGRTGLGTWRIDEDLKALVFQTPDSLRFVKLGELGPDQTGFHLGVDIRAQADDSDFGFFLGFQADQADQTNSWQFQSIELHWPPILNPEPSSYIRRYLAKLNSRDSQTTGDRNFSKRFLIHPAPAKLRLEITVLPNRINLISIYNDSIEELCSQELNGAYQDWEYKGKFGFFARNGTVYFSNPVFERIQK